MKFMSIRDAGNTQTLICEKIFIKAYVLLKALRFHLQLDSAKLNTNIISELSFGC